VDYEPLAAAFASVSRERNPPTKESEFHLHSVHITNAYSDGDLLTEQVLMFNFIFLNCFKIAGGN
jgi:hypothetical protein